MGAPGMRVSASMMLTGYEKMGPGERLDFWNTWVRAGETSGAFGEMPAPVKTLQATPFQWIEPTDIPRRAWIYARHYIRRFVSTTVAPGGVGKTARAISEALAICTGRALLDVKPDEQTNVWLWNGEDPQEELQRRVIAAATHYEIEPSELAGRLYVDTGRETKIIIAEMTKNGAVVARPMVDAVIQAIRERDVGVFIVDPFVACHRVTENDNNAIESVVSAWAEIADATGCAIELIHHARKTGGTETTVEDARGASALLAKARSARVINPMTKDEAAKADVENRRLYFRSENGKANLTIPAEKADWFHLASVDLGNGPPEAGGLGGDSVGVVTTWDWPDALENVTAADLLAVQNAVSAGQWRENSQANDWVGKAVAGVLKLDIENKAHRTKITALMKVWIGNGMFVTVTGEDSKRNKRSFVEVGEWAR